MRYYFTDFSNWEQPLINQLRREGKFVYSVIDTGGSDYEIVYKQCCNRFAFLITDEDILDGVEYLDNKEFVALGGTEDECLRNSMVDVSAECAEALKEYERRKRS